MEERRLTHAAVVRCRIDGALKCPPDGPTADLELRRERGLGRQLIAGDELPDQLEDGLTYAPVLGRGNEVCFNH